MSTSIFNENYYCIAAAILIKGYQNNNELAFKNVDLFIDYIFDDNNKTHKEFKTILKEFVRDMNESTDYFLYYLKPNNIKEFKLFLDYLCSKFENKDNSKFLHLDWFKKHLTF